MRTIYHSIILSLFCFCIISCTNGNGLKKASSTYLPESTIHKIVTEELEKENLLTRYTPFKVGYYEENDEDDRYELRKLAAAGVITYDVKRIEEKVRVWDGYEMDDRTYRWVDKYKTVSEYRYFVATDLTDAGKKLMVYSLPRYEEKLDKYLTPPTHQSFPEDTVSRKENWGDEVETLKASSSSVSNTAKSNNSSGTEPKKDEPKTEYEKEKAREYTTDMWVKTHSLKVMDARNILVKDGEAMAIVIVDYKDVTPFGRILKYNREGEHEVFKVSFQYWQDLGWTVEELDN
jgi:hypothetical protein